MTASLKIENTGVPVARISGEVDMTNAARIGSQLRGAVPNTAAGMVIDLAETTFIDSKGIHLILGLAGDLAAHGQQLALALPQDSRLRRVFVITRLHEEVPLYDNTGDAIARVSASAAAGRYDQSDPG
jgi:anti-anti-sigma factor